MVLPSFLISRKQYLDMIFIHVYWVIQVFFLSWLLKPFPENQNTPTKHLRFNHCLSHSRITIEDTFGHWKGPFSRFAKRIDMKVEGVVHLAAASCILHDISGLRRDPIVNKWSEQAQDSDYPQPDDRND